MTIAKKQITFTGREILTIKAMISYMLTEEDLDKVDENFADKLFSLEAKFMEV